MHMRSRFLVSFLFAALTTGAVAQKFTKQMVKLAPVPPAAAADFSQESFVVEKWLTSCSFENDGSGKREVRARIKVQSEAGVQQWGQVVFGYNSANEKVEIPYVRVLKADGSTVTAPSDSVQDLSVPLQKEAPMYTDFRQKHITVPGLRPGDTLEYDIVDVTATPLAPGQFWLEYDFQKNWIVLEERLEISIPHDRTVKLKTAKDRDPKVADANGRRVYSWTSSHLEKEEDDQDAAKKPKAKAKPEPEQPEVQLTTFASWEDVGKWYAALEQEKRQPTADIKAKAAELTANMKTDMEKIEALYDYVGPNFRYVSLSLGVGRYQPHSAADVLHNQYGDCKDKNTLLAALLDASGFHSYSVLIGSSRKLDPEVPSPAQFDHVITLLPLGKEEVWMDTTTEVAPFRLLSYNIRKKQALVVSSTPPPHLEETPSNPPMENRQVQVLDGKVTDFGKLEMHIQYTMRGDTELFARMIFRHVPNSKWQMVVERMNAVMGAPGDVSDLKISNPAETHEPFSLDYKVTVANFLDWSKKKSELTLPLSQITLPDADADADKNADPIPLAGPAEYQYKIRLEFPPKYSTSAPLPFSMKRDYGRYEATYKVDGPVFSAERELNLNERELPATRSDDFLSFRRAVIADTAQRLAVDSTAAGTPTAPSDLKGADLDEAANAALNRGNLQLAVDLYKRAVEADPKDKTAWVNLGRAYMGLRQTDNAILAFRKQTELNPYDEQGYANLGWAYTMQRKYDDAIAVYGKALEINPLSEYAHSALGHIYSEQHQYDKAAAELEKAVSLHSDNADLQVALGDAYLNLGEDTKALAAFDRAVDIAATPEVWNNIAYQLSEKHAHLDRAQQYAESAVTAVSTALRNVTLAQLNQRDLALVASLTADWDTLGWVYFARGNMDKAETYVKASWIAQQHGEVGDHLGQVYEKEGKKDEAIRAYAMALSGLRPIPETRGRLAALVGGADKVDAEVAKHSEELPAIRTVKLGKADKTGSAEFFVVLVPSSSGPVVDEVKFIMGDDSLKTYAEALRTAKYNFIFPDATQTKVVRRGILSCSKTTGECVFVMLLPEDVRAVN